MRVMLHGLLVTAHFLVVCPFIALGLTMFFPVISDLLLLQLAIWAVAFWIGWRLIDALFRIDRSSYRAASTGNEPWKPVGGVGGAVPRGPSYNPNSGMVEVRNDAGLGTVSGTYHSGG